MGAFEYDLAIVGAGSAGLIAADFAVRLGARVALLERDRIGGDCTWTGCVPSKALLKIAKVAHDARTAAQYGVHLSPPVIDMAQARQYMRGAIGKIDAGTTPEALRQKGIDVLPGPVSFLDAHTLAVGERRVRAAKVLIATGARPVSPALPGLAEVSFETYRSIFENDRLPASLAVIGGGPVGVEITQAYQRLGAQVTLYAERLLPGEEPEASAVVQRVLEREGVRVILGRALAVGAEAGGVRVFSGAAGAESAVSEMLFVAAGREPVVDGLQLEVAGVRMQAGGIAVNEHLQTSVPTIYAAGDVLGGLQYSHLAGWQGYQAARNALLPGNHAGFCAVVPRVTFCDPEVAQAGLLEEAARARFGARVRVERWGLDRVDRAVCENDRDGFVKVIATEDGTIVGAAIVARRAGEAIMEFVAAMHLGIKADKLAGIIHPYPTYSSAVQFVTTELAMRRAFSGVSGKLLRMAAKLM
jgi:pyruvate/2-oxoglutarate dehydrogenase complex dihydrolipoamide dehydrogenase (E3) component